MHTSTRGSAATDLSPVHPPQRVDSLRATAAHRKTLAEVTGDDDGLPAEGDFALHEATEECVQPVEIVEVHHRSLIPQ